MSRGWRWQQITTEMHRWCGAESMKLLPALFLPASPLLFRAVTQPVLKATSGLIEHGDT